MSFVAKPFTDGELPIVQGTIYAVPFGIVSYVKHIFLFNKNAATQTIDVYLNTSGSVARRWRRLVLTQNQSADMLKNGEALQLVSGNTIEAVTTTAAAVDYIVSGVEETP
jgi:hypothetical protein